MKTTGDFDAAITMHLDWLEHLRSHVRGEGKDPAIDLACASDYSGCSLGRWLAAVAPDRGGQADFDRLVMLHKLFHTLAGDVTLLVREGQIQAASFVVDSQMSELSRDMVHSIEAMKHGSTG